MKRAGFVVVLLLCCGGLVYLLLDASEDPARRRAPGEGVPGESADRSAQSEQGANEDLRAAVADDRDPNRVPGPAVVVSGRVTRDGSPVPGATVTLERVDPVENTMQTRWESVQREGRPAPPIATTQTLSDGSFRIGMARRSVVTVHVHGRGSAHAFRRLLIPRTGDPDPVEIELEAGSTLRGIVLSADNEPVAGARVRNRNPFEEEESGEDGRFEFADLQPGSKTVEVYAEGHPALRRWVTAPYDGELVFRLGPGGAVEGRITTDRGEPVAGASVRISTADPSGRGVFSFAIGLTDESGRYRLDSLAPGAINGVGVRHPEWPSISIDVYPTERVEAGKVLTFDMEIESGQPLRGVVLRAEDRVAVPGAVVTVLTMNESYRGLYELTKVRADKDGRFVVPHVPEGTYSLDAHTDGYARRVRRYAQQGHPFTIDLFVDRDEAPPEQTVLLDPAGAVIGQVVGSAVNGLVTLTFATGNQNTRVDDFGSFAFEAVPVGEGLEARLNQPQATSEPFDVRAGETTEIELDVFVGGGFVGVVVDPGGQPVAGARVGVSPTAWRGRLGNLLSDSGGWGAATADADGRFRIPVPQWLRSSRGQKVTAAAAHRDFSAGSVTGLEIPEAGRKIEVRIELGPAGRVTGRVEFEDGAPAPEITVRAAPRQPKGFSGQEIRQRRSAVTAPDGTFELSGLGEGDYGLSVWHPEAKQIDSPVVQAGLTDLRIVLRRTESISGFVRFEDGTALPSQSASVYALIPQGKGTRQQHGSIQTGGLFRIPHLEPGQYEIEVAPRQQSWQVKDSFEKVRTPPVVTGTTDVLVEVSPGARISGNVVDPSGKGVAGAGVIAMPLQLAANERGKYYNQSRPSCITNGRGWFEIKGVGKEEVELVAVATGFRPASLRVAPNTKGARIQLQAGAVFEGTLLQHDGTPVRRQWINIEAVAKEMRDRYSDWNQRGGQSWNIFGGYQLTGTQTDEKGKFVFTGLEPGEYRFGNFYNFNGVAPNETYRTGSGKYVIRLIVPYTIKGAVVGPDGLPVQPKTGQVWINARAGERYIRGAMVASDGSFVLEGLSAGPVTLQIHASGYAPATTEVQAGADNVRIVLQPQKR